MTNEETLALAHAIEEAEKCQGITWLVRSNERGIDAYFANMIKRNDKGLPVATFPMYGETPGETLQASVDAYLEARPNLETAPND